MGCAFSREDPRVFQVWNVDSDGHPLKPGKIEVTDTQLILYQKKNIVVRWPLNTLRRYGFDSEVFSFESGRRCTTGAGIYAFKCRRAHSLFSILQECINNSGVTPSTIDDQITLLPHDRIAFQSASASLPNGSINNAEHSTLTVDSAGYLEPITVTTHFHYPILPARNNNGTTSPGGYVCIHNSTLEDWPTFACTCCSLGNLAGNSSMHHYENNEVLEQAAAGCSNSMCTVNQTVNTTEAVVQSDLTRPCSLPSQCCPEQTYVNSAIVTLSPSHLHCVDNNTNYAKLDDLMKEEQRSVKLHKDQHFYVNVKPDGNSVSSVSPKSGRSTPTDGQLVSSPTSQGSVHASSCYVNLVGSPSHCYANLGSPPQSEAKELPQVNYVVLDLDQTDSTNGTVASTPVSLPSSVHSLVSSPVHSQEGGSHPYAQIDYDKTVALSNSANPSPAFNDDSIRKTRHNAVIPCASMSA